MGNQQQKSTNQQVGGEANVFGAGTLRKAIQGLKQSCLSQPGVMAPSDGHLWIELCYPQ